MALAAILEHSLKKTRGGLPSRGQGAPIPPAATRLPTNMKLRKPNKETTRRKEKERRASMKQTCPCTRKFPRSNILRNGHGQGERRKRTFPSKGFSHKILRLKEKKKKKLGAPGPVSRPPLESAGRGAIPEASNPRGRGACRMGVRPEPTHYAAHATSQTGRNAEGRPQGGDKNCDYIEKRE